MLYQKKQNPELYQLKHMYDNELHRGFDYENNSIVKSVTPVLLRNKTMNTFLYKIQQLIAVWFDEVSVHPACPQRDITIFMNADKMLMNQNCILIKT